MTSGYASLKPLLVLALLFTLLNAFKPLCIDDALYYYHAQQISQHPLDPYGFTIFWNDRPELAIQNLAPVLMQYWWAIAIRLFGDHPFIWKLWLFPYALLLVFSLHSLIRRFASGYEMILTWMVVISPVFLPSFNLMLDVPALALSLFAIVIFLRASERDSHLLAALAGLVAGIAAQTKYNGLVAPAVILLHSLIFRKLRLGVLAAMIAGLFFVSWEGFIFLGAGRSHFLTQSQTYGSVNLLAKYAYLAGPLVTIMGAVAPFFMLIALIALGVRKKTLSLAAALVVLGYLALIFVPTRFQTLSRDSQTYEASLTIAHLIFSIYGAAFFVSVLLVIRKLVGLSEGLGAFSTVWRKHKTELFLVGWWTLEIVAYFGLSPIPAVRRVLALLVVSTLLIGRLAFRTVGPGSVLLRRAAFGSMLLGLLFYAVDFRDAYVEKAAVEKSSQKIAAIGPTATTWYVARWGFQYYAERAGMKPVLPDQSDFQPGDWLVVSDSVYFPKPVSAHINRYKIDPVAQVVLEDRLPLRTMLGFYNSGLPIQHHEGPRRTIKIYRIAGPATLGSPR
ncbi:MAG: hypothetical protein M3R52_04725 [Acidobacteriota bacterium]|nr:hypothetical protein [Acidobacteriota bacterium]